MTELITKLRWDLMVHSYIYYTLGDSVVTDAEWDTWAKQLVEEQAANPSHTDEYDEYFADWSGETGMHLPALDDVVTEADRLLAEDHIGPKYDDPTRK